MRAWLVGVILVGTALVLADADVVPPTEITPVSAFEESAEMGPDEPLPRGRLSANAGSNQSPVGDRPKPFSTRLRGPGADFVVGPGERVFHLRIPTIGLNEWVVQGADRAQLAHGPGHYPECGNGFYLPYCSQFDEVWPGERGRAVVGGHRTLATRPFFHLGRLSEGDRIIVRAEWGRFLYIVQDRKVVPSDDRTIIVPGVDRPELLLVTCHPKFSAAQRLLIFSKLVRSPTG